LAVCENSLPAPVESMWLEETHSAATAAIGEKKAIRHIHHTIASRIMAKTANGG